jgi:glycosyltransferase involved in cell wall biosynthesis
MKASIIIPVYNEEKDIGHCLESLKNQSMKDFEIILVDDGSTDNTVAVVKEFKKVKVIQGQHKGPGFSRNLGAKSARGEILIFVDADMTFDKDYLKNLIAPLQKDDKLIGTTHDYEIVNNLDNIWSRCWGKVRVDARKLAYKTMKSGSPYRAIRKSDFMRLGGFDPKYGYADDQTFRFKYNLNPIFAPNTTCYHKNPETLRAVYRQSLWIISPLAIPLLSLRRCQKNRDFAILPQMLIFMLARYAGMVVGLSRKIYLNNNVR